MLASQETLKHFSAVERLDTFSWARHCWFLSWPVA